MVALAASTLGRARRQEHGYALVWQGAGISDAVEVMRRAVASVLAASDTSEVDSPSYSTGVLETPKGPSVWLDMAKVSEDYRVAFPRLVSDALVALGHTRGKLTIPVDRRTFDKLYDPESIPVAAAFWYPTREWRETGAIPPPLVEAAFEWLGVASHDPVEANDDLLVFAVSGADARTRWTHWCASDTQAKLVVFEKRLVRGCARTFSVFGGGVSVFVSGEDLTRADVCQVHRELCALTETLAASLAYAAVGPQPNLREAFRAQPAVPDIDWLEGVLGTTASLQMQHTLRWGLDDGVPDAFPFQVLGPAHLKRLGPLAPPGRPLEAGRLAVTFGTVEQWLDPATARVLRNEGLDALAACVLTRDEIDGRIARWREAFRRDS